MVMQHSSSSSSLQRQPSLQRWRLRVQVRPQLTLQQMLLVMHCRLPSGRQQRPRALTWPSCRPCLRSCAWRCWQHKACSCASHSLQHQRHHQQPQLLLQQQHSQQLQLQPRARQQQAHRQQQLLVVRLQLQIVMAVQQLLLVKQQLLQFLLLVLLHPLLLLLLLLLLRMRSLPLTLSSWQHCLRTSGRRCWHSSGQSSVHVLLLRGPQLSGASSRPRWALLTCWPLCLMTCVLTHSHS
jgi:hypothetical protein